MPDFNFEENNSVDDINSVPEKYRGLYVEAEGKFSLSPAAQGIVGDYVGLNKTLAGIRVDKKKVTDENAERRLATKAVEEFVQSLGLDVSDDGVVDTLKAHVEDLVGQVKGGKELKINLEKVNKDWERRMAELGTSKDNEIAEMRGALSKHLISDAASRALAGAKGSIELLLPHVERQCKVVRNEDGSYAVTVLDDQGDSRFNGSGGLYGVADLVAEMKTQDKYGRAFESEAPPGSGVKPGSMGSQTVRNTMQSQQRELSPTEKIREGLRKGQAVDGRGGSTLAGRG